jgi:acetate---CoA ligase (ADP-forming)
VGVSAEADTEGPPEPGAGVVSAEADAEGPLEPGAGASAEAEAEGPLVRDVLLLDGSTMRLRLPRPEDREDVKAFYDALSPESRYLRFHGYLPTDRAARELVQASGVDRLTLIGHHGGRIVATAQYDGLREPGVAEVAFAVAEEFRHRGAATRLLEQLAHAAAERGIHRFDAYVIPGNRAMLTVFEHAGFGVRSRGVGGEITVSMDIRPSTAVQQRIDERDHIGAVASLMPILAPGSVAIAGEVDERSDSAAMRSDSAAARGGRPDLAAIVLASIREGGYQGRIVEIDEGPDLAIVVAAAERFADVARRAAESGAKGVLVLSDDGRADPARREELLEVVRAGGLRLLGPNSLGVMNTAPEVSLDATIAGVRVTPGRLAICSQSGTVGIGLLGHAAARDLGISSFVSLGDRLDVSTNDLLEFWEEDQRTAAVMLYVEAFGNPQHFARIAQRVSRRKPILVVKGRRAAEAARADAGSHTAAALRGDAVVDALFHQAGMLRFRSGEELFSCAQFFASQPLANGRRVAILSNSYGVATLAADACATRGLVVNGADDQSTATVVDDSSPPDRYAGQLTTMLLDEGVDAVMVYYVERYGGDPEAVLQAVSRAAAGTIKPVVASIIGNDGRLPAAGPGSVPNFLFPETCATVLARGLDRREWLSRPLGEPARFDDVDVGGAQELIAAALGSQHGAGDIWLSLPEVEVLLATHGIRLVPSRRCADVEAALAAAREIEGPVALKAALEPPAHAADLDAVLLGLEGEAAVRGGWEQLVRRMKTAGRPWNGALIQGLAGPGADVLVGAVTDPDLGPVMAVGPGGRDAALATTVAFRLLPGTDLEADELVDASSGVVARLAGFRGAEPLDREALRELVLRFAALLGRCPEIVEADLNPVRLMAHGYVVLDARIRVEHRHAPERVKTW